MVLYRKSLWLQVEAECSFEKRMSATGIHVIGCRSTVPLSVSAASPNCGSCFAPGACRQKTLGARTTCSRCNSLQGRFCGMCLFNR